MKTKKPASGGNGDSRAANVSLDSFKEQARRAHAFIRENAHYVASVLEGGGIPLVFFEVDASAVKDVRQCFASGTNWNGENTIARMELEAIESIVEGYAGTPMGAWLQDTSKARIVLFMGSTMRFLEVTEDGLVESKGVGESAFRQDSEPVVHGL